MTSIAFIGSAAGLSGCFQPANAGRKTGKYIDVHVHIGHEWMKDEHLTVTSLLNWMDANSVEKSVVLPLISPESWFYPVSTDYVLKETAAHRDRLIPFCAIDPRTLNLGGRGGTVSLLKEYIDRGARGFGEHKTGVAIDDPRNMVLYESLSEVGLPCLFHLDNSRNMDKVGLPGLEKVLKTFPNVPMIGHANGWWASIDGDAVLADFQAYPKRKIVRQGAVDRLLAEYPNLYGDLSAGSGANAISRDPEFGREFVIRNANKLMFGTDYLKIGQQVPQFDLYENMDLPAEVRTKVYRGNADRLFG
jgi:predicted TIM-barrel fold metal-dependent hydrolase